VQIVKVKLNKLYLLVCLTLGLFFTGCQTSDTVLLPMLEVASNSIHLSKENQCDTLTFRNVGDDVLIWWVFNKPDWAIIADQRGEIPEGDSAFIQIIGDLSIGIGQFSDSIEFRSDGGDAVVNLTMDVDVLIPNNGVYSGTTLEGLRIAYLIDYNRILEFQGFFYDGEQVRVEHLPVFGEIQYTDTTFTVEGDHDFTLTGIYDGVSSINGSWILIDGRNIGYSVTREE